MKPHLLYRDRDFDWQWALAAAADREAARTGRRRPTGKAGPRGVLPWNAADLAADLDLHALFTAMAAEDDLIVEVARRALLTATGNEIDTIRYRQEVLRDCLDHPDVVRELYLLATEAMREQGRHYLGSLTSRYPDAVLRWSIETLEALLGSMQKLRRIAERNAGSFSSEGWTTLFATLRRELDESYLALVRQHLTRLGFQKGVLLSARLGSGNRGTDHVLHPPPLRNRGWLTRLAGEWLPRLLADPSETRSFTLHPRDEAGFRMLGELKNRGIAIAAGALGRSADHVRGFFALLRTELAFYVGCLNLREALVSKGQPVCLPSPADAGTQRLSFRGLYDVCLALKLERPVVGNDVDADRRNLILVTGANRGGKTTFLRSIGLAQLMMQAGMFVPAERFRSSVCDGLFTHFRREEDVEMRSGRLDEELGRMSNILDRITSHPMILFNESFAATNEREGSEIATQITRALLERGVRMLFVTHLSEFALRLHESGRPEVLFLRADRRADGTRTFRLVEGRPLWTGFGQDLYDRIFGGHGAGPGDAAEHRMPVSANRSST